MKLYCILHDTAPLTQDMLLLAKSNGLDILRPVGQCYTFSSLTSMLTGKLACDLLDKGMGWGTWKTYQDPKTKELKLPWISQMLPEILRKMGWKVHVHDYTVYNRLVDTSPDNIYTDILRPNSNDDYIFKNTAAIKECYERERKFISEEQNKKSEQNIVYFFYYNHFHESLLIRKGSEEAKERVNELLSFWDFSEADAMFWVFSDHGDWTGIFELLNWPSPVNYLTWVLFRDNISPSTCTKSKFISIRDFYTTIVNKFRLTGVPTIPDIRSITEPQDPDRIYYVEDARAQVDIYNSTTAVACRFVDWKDGVPRGVLQVVYYKPENKFIGTYTLLNDLGFVTSTSEVEIDSTLRRALISRIGWIDKGKVNENLHLAGQ